MPTEAEILEALKAVIDPELKRSIVELGMVRSIDIDEAGTVDVVVSLTTPGCPIKAHFERDVAENVRALDGVEHVRVTFDTLSDSEKEALRTKLGRPGLPAGALAQVSNVVCIASGKGGVGKSTVTANLAAALSSEGKRVGVVDCDVYGYSIPSMLGIEGLKPGATETRKIRPVQAPGDIQAISVGFFVEPGKPILWRGPMLHGAIRQFIEDVEWGELDFLLLDLPPGTGDVAMTLAQLLPQARFLVVTTPQPVAQEVAQRAADMAKEFDLPICGVIENMSGFNAPDGTRVSIFGEGGGQLLADNLDAPLLAKVPLSEPLRESGDAGEPLVLSDPDSPPAQALRQAARGLIAQMPAKERPVVIQN